MKGAKSLGTLRGLPPLGFTLHALGAAASACKSHLSTRAARAVQLVLICFEAGDHQGMIKSDHRDVLASSQQSC